MSNKTYILEPPDDDGKFTPEKAGLPDMNVTFEYDHSMNNGIALITKAVMYVVIQDINDPDSEMTDDERAKALDILYNPGYAPMERLAKAIAFGKDGTDPYNIPENKKDRYAVDFANDLERIAFAIRPDMFAKNSIIGNEQPSEPLQPVPGGGHTSA